MTVSINTRRSSRGISSIEVEETVRLSGSSDIAASVRTPLPTRRAEAIRIQIPSMCAHVICAGFESPGISITPTASS